MTRTKIIQAVIDHIDSGPMRALRDSVRYLEIGIFDPDRNFNHIKAGYKLGLDIKRFAAPDILEMASDDFFFVYKGPNFDVIFVDGDHSYKQVKEDVVNALSFLNPGGFVIMHDCNPQTRDAAAPEKPSPNATWNGEAYRVFLECRADPRLDCFCVDCDHGMGIVQEHTRTFSEMIEARDYDYEDLAANRAELLELVPPYKLKEALHARSR